MARAKKQQQRRRRGSEKKQRKKIHCLTERARERQSEHFFGVLMNCVYFWKNFKLSYHGICRARTVLDTAHRVTHPEWCRGYSFSVNASQCTLIRCVHLCRSMLEPFMLLMLLPLLLLVLLLLFLLFALVFFIHLLGFIRC